MPLTVPTRTLNTGTPIPQLGLGTWPLDDGGAGRAVGEALEAGYRLVDTAALYRNERGVGEGIRASGVPREEVFVTTKLRGGDQGYGSALRAFDASRRRLGLEYVDLYLIHWPLPHLDLYVDTWRAFETLLADGRARAVGVSNFTTAHLTRLLAETDVVPAVNQVELHPYLTQPELRSFDADHGIVTESYTPLAHAGRLLAEPAVVDIAQRHGRTPAQVVLRWHVEHGLVAIPKSGNPRRIRENLAAIEFELSPDEVGRLDALDRARRLGGDPDVTDER